MPLIRSEAFAVQQESSVRSALRAEMEAEYREQLEAARSEGRREGFEAGLNEARASVADAISSMAKVDASVEAELERILLKLVVAVLRKIAGDDVHPETTRSIVRNAIQSSIVDAASVVLVSQEDVSLVREAVDHPDSLRLEVDRSLEAGEIVVVSPLGRRRLGQRDQIAALLRQLAPTAGGA